MDLYFERHDSTGATCDDFRAAMANANGVDLDTLSQSSNSDKPLFFPVSVGLIDNATGRANKSTCVKGRDANVRVRER